MSEKKVRFVLDGKAPQPSTSRGELKVNEDGDMVLLLDGVLVLRLNAETGSVNRYVLTSTDKARVPWLSVTNGRITLGS